MKVLLNDLPTPLAARFENHDIIVFDGTCVLYTGFSGLSSNMHGSGLQICNSAIAVGAGHVSCFGVGYAGF